MKPHGVTTHSSCQIWFCDSRTWVSAHCSIFFSRFPDFTMSRSPLTEEDVFQQLFDEDDSGSDVDEPLQFTIAVDTVQDDLHDASTWRLEKALQPSTMKTRWRCCASLPMPLKGCNCFLQCTTTPPSSKTRRRKCICSTMQLKVGLTPLTRCAVVHLSAGRRGGGLSASSMEL